MDDALLQLWRAKRKVGKNLFIEGQIYMYSWRK